MKFSFIALLFALSLAAFGQAPRQMERLGRGVVAVRNSDGKAFVSWRVLGTDPDGIAFNLYRETAGGKAEKLNRKPIADVSFFVDDSADAAKDNAYFVRPVVKKKEEAPSSKFVLAAGSNLPYLRIPVQPPAGYSPNDGSVGDLDGDGEYEFVVHMAGRGADNSRSGLTSEPVLQAYKLDGTLLWTINLGRNIREGAHYTQFLVYDFDGDGRAEVACKTADGTTDGKGVVIGDKTADWRAPQGATIQIGNPDGGGGGRKTDITGKILAGPEFLTVFDGLTGAALSTVPYDPPRHPATMNPTGTQLNEVWGDGYGNRADRFLAAVAYLDGVHPSLVFSRGYYTRTVVAAWDFKDKKLVKRWTFDSASSPENKKFGGQGNHNLSVGDLDGDGRDEIVFGAMALDDDGRGLYSTGLGHGDALHLSDLDPTRPGLEVFDIQERFDDAGASFRDARTGEILWKKASVKAGDDGEGPGRGLSLDIDPRHKGFESWVFGAGLRGLWDAKGNVITEKNPRSCNFGIFWDGDTLSELLDRNAISKWNWEKEATDVIMTADGAVWNNGTKANPVLSADILGDWREEVIWRSADNKELRLYTTTIPTKERFYTFMHDPQYRLSIAWQNVAYNQPPHTSFFVGDGMAKPPKPRIFVK